jgi:chromosome segregation ATPase
LIEPAMFFVAGLLVAGLAGLLILPAFAARAYRLAAARARLLAPLSMKDVVAERDLLRAEHALEQHRLERRLAAAQDAAAHHRADLGRQAASIVAMEAESARLSGEISDLREDLSARERDARGLEGDLGASRIALNDFSARLDRAAGEILALSDRRVALETTADGQRTVIAGLETRAAGLEIKLGDALHAAKSASAAAEAEKARLSSELAARAATVERLSAELSEAAAKSASLAAEIEGKSGELEKNRGRLAELDAAARGTTEGDAALRQAISQLAADVIRVSGAATDGQASQSGADRADRRPSDAPPTQGPAGGERIAPPKFRKLQSIVPRR